MSNRACPKCSIVYHRISDSTLNPICKKCGGAVIYWDSDFVKGKVEHDFWWSSNNKDPSNIDPDYKARK